AGVKWHAIGVGHVCDIAGQFAWLVRPIARYARSSSIDRKINGWIEVRVGDTGDRARLLHARLRLLELQIAGPSLLFNFVQTRITKYLPPVPLGDCVLGPPFPPRRLLFESVRDR